MNMNNITSFFSSAATSAANTITSSAKKIAQLSMDGIKGTLNAVVITAVTVNELANRYKEREAAIVAMTANPSADNIRQVQVAQERLQNFKTIIYVSTIGKINGYNDRMRAAQLQEAINNQIPSMPMAGA